VGLCAINAAAERQSTAARLRISPPNLLIFINFLILSPG
jgi:hypothetical protein